MQLLKLVHSYNTTNQATKPTPKNYYLSILENFVHVPKDDKLVIRKYLCGLKTFDENNQVLAILNKNSKKSKQNVDKKLEVLLRKIADRIRKQDQRQMLNKPTQPQPKTSIPQATINVRKYCNNLELLKTTLRMPSSKNSDSKSQQKSLTCSSKKLNFILQSMSPKNTNIRNYSSTRSQKQVKPKTKFDFLKKPLFQMYQTNRTASQESKNRKNNLSSQKKSSQKKIGRNENKQVKFFEQQAPKHKYSRSRSLGDLIQNITDFPNQNYETAPNESFNSNPILEPISHHYEYQQFSSFGNNHTEAQYNSNTSSYNFQNFIDPAVQSMSSFFTPQQHNAKSVHIELKELRLCSEDFLDFLMPISIKESRSPSDFSFLYSEFIKKLNQFLRKSLAQKAPVFSSDTVYIPFHTQYDLVTFEKIAQFLDEYTTPKLSQNPVRNLYTRIEAGVCGTTASIFNHKRISISQFKKCYEWNKNAIQKFERLVRRCSRWGNCLTYWQLYWLKDSEEFAEFQKQFNP